MSINRRERRKKKERSAVKRAAPLSQPFTNLTYGLIARLQLPVHLLVHLSVKIVVDSLVGRYGLKAVAMCGHVLRCGGKVGVQSCAYGAGNGGAKRGGFKRAGSVDDHTEDVGGDLHDLVTLRTAARDYKFGDAGFTTFF